MVSDLFDVDLKNRTVIVADDDQITRGLLRAILSVSGLNVVGETINGERTVAAFKRQRPDIVCIDIDMPGMNGLEVLRQIRSLAPDAVLIIVSAETTAENIQQAIEAGANGIVAKPFNTARIRAELKRALHKKVTRPA